MMQWIEAHQALLLLMWPVLTALVSIFYKQLDQIPRVHALLSVLTAVGVDLPKLWEALGRLVTGNPPSVGGPGTGVRMSSVRPPPDMPSSFPKKPAAMRVASWAAALLGVTYIGAIPFGRRVGKPLVWNGNTYSWATPTAGCSLLNNPVYIAQQLATYVNAFISTAQTVWDMIAPLLGNNAGPDTVLFKDAIVVLQNANALMMDGANAIAAGKGKDVNLPQLISAVQDAVSRVMAIIRQFQTSTPAASYAGADKVGHLEHMAASIQHWEDGR